MNAILQIAAVVALVIAGQHQQNAAPLQVTEDAKLQTAYSLIDSAMENGVQVVRRSRAMPAAQLEAAGANSGVAPALLRDRPVSPYPLARVRIPDNWKYNKRMTAGTQRSMTWEYKERRDRTYRRVRERSHVEVEALTRYRKTLD